MGKGLRMKWYFWGTSTSKKMGENVLAEISIKDDSYYIIAA